MDTQVTIVFLLLASSAIVLQHVAGDDIVTFLEKTADETKTSPAPKSSSAQPKNSGVQGDEKTKDGVKPRIGFDAGGMSSSFNFGVQPSGGISGSASFSNSYGNQGQGQTGSQSQSFNFQAGSNGFSASQAASQSSSFNSQHPGYYGHGPSVSGSQASSQASSISGGLGGVSGSSAASQASSFGHQGSGAGFGGSSSSANSQGFSSSLGRPGGGYGYYPNGGYSGSGSQSAGASISGFGFENYPNNLPPEYIRGHQPNKKNPYGRRKPSGWFSHITPEDEKTAIVFPS